MYVRRTGTVRYYCSDRCYKFDVVHGKKQRMKEQKAAAKAASKAK